ncbi:MAG: YihY/virulence factor BrkB family protein [Planctomycetales bacterium]|nr:YihY/virulence factor BrkB family protein [Planctomycetales bacterium]
MLRIGKQIWEAAQRWLGDDGGLMAASVAYYAALSMFPLLLVLISGLGFFLRYSHIGQDAEAQVVSAISDYASAEVGNDVREMLSGVQEQAAVGGPTGIVVLLFAAIDLFANFERAFNRIWNVDDPESHSWLGTVRNIIWFRLRAFLLLIAVGVLILVVFVAGMAFATVRAYGEQLLPSADWLWQIGQLMVSIGLNTCVFTLLYRFLPRLEIRWREAAQGAALTAVAWEVGRAILAAFLIGNKYTAYGVVGSFIAIMLWIYYAASIIFLGAEYVQVVCRDCDSRSDEPNHSDSEVAVT